MARESIDRSRRSSSSASGEGPIGYRSTLHMLSIELVTGWRGGHRSHRRIVAPPAPDAGPVAPPRGSTDGHEVSPAERRSRAASRAGSVIRDIDAVLDSPRKMTTEMLGATATETQARLDTEETEPGFSAIDPEIVVGSAAALSVGAVERHLS